MRLNRAIQFLGGTTLCLSLLLGMFTSAWAAESRTLSEQYGLTFRLGEQVSSEKFSVVADTQGRVEMRVPFISGGCIQTNELTIVLVKDGEEGEKVINLLWNTDYGAPCKAAIPMLLTANFQLPGPGVFRIRLWEASALYSKKLRLGGEQKVMVPERP